MNPPDDWTSLAMMLGRLERLNDELLTDVCNRHDMSTSEFRVLAMLRNSGPDPVRPATIARWVLQTAGGLSATLRRLEGAGRIERRADPDDGRGTLVELTADGADFHDQLIAEVTERYQLALGAIDTETARRVVVELVGAFERFGNHPHSAGWQAAAV